MASPNSQPINQWGAYAHPLFWNWIGDIYQNAPYDISRIGEQPARARLVGRGAAV